MQTRCTSARLKLFYDIQLKIKDKKKLLNHFVIISIQKRFKGDNKYEAGENGLHEAEKVVIFVSFTPICTYI